MYRSLLVVSLLGGAAFVFGCDEKKVEQPAQPTTPPPATPVAPTPTAPTGTTPTPTGTTPAPTGTAPTPAATAPAPAGATGSIKGSVAFTGTAPAPTPLKRDSDPFCAKTKMNSEDVLVNANKTLKNVLVRLTNVTGNFEAPATPATVVQEACMYRPRVQGVVAGQAIQVKNGDQTLHNVHTFKGTTTLFNQAQIPGSAPIEKKFNDAGALLKFKCDVHPWMAGYISVTNHPFFAVTGDDGSFELKNVPAGAYKMEVWHEKFGSKMVDVTVAAGAAADAKVSFDGTETAK